ncbi:Bardet-Biedl syndrome 12 protein [Thalassophryne amazonica]|uniref:Bardet-Biedl syndrome 12 protein n=1 Tax=Thalassophryne amazonica TaxID=390379 RepID=UPI001470D426|nr:Bardet-Biedl syndrome 12 protein [Thalassophryne amazonica]
MMPGSAIRSLRQHVGLQKLSGLAGIAHSSLGPNKSYKFIQDDASGESSLACSCFRILENLELICAVGQLVYETIQAHQKVYHSGSGSMLFLAGAWSRVMLECLDRGISVAHIMSAMSEGMDICLNVCRKYSILTDGLNCTVDGQGLNDNLLMKPIVQAPCALFLLDGTAGAEKTSKQRRVKLSHSRHFYEVMSENVCTMPKSGPCEPASPDIAHLAEGLSHGCADMMHLVIKVSKIQSENCQHFTFDVTKVVSCLMPGLPEEHACVFPGCIVLTSSEQASVAEHFKEQNLKVSLIHGDLSDTYRHPGYSAPKGIRRVCDQLDSRKEEDWMEGVLTHLLRLDVNVVLASGVACEKLVEHCCRHCILVVQKVKMSVLKAFADATGAAVVRYATQLNDRCVGIGVNVAVWRDFSSKSSTVVNISTCGSSGLVTVIITSCVHSKALALEDQFWACAYRLHHALKEKALLPGAGVTELLCVSHLQKHAEHLVKPHADGKDAASLYTATVLHLMADALIDYISTMMVNTGNFSKVRARTVLSQHLEDCDGDLSLAGKFSQLFLEGHKQDSFLSSEMKSCSVPAVKVYDNMSIKQEVWRKALDVVFLVLQTDAEVITGVDPNTEGENLMLL